MQLSTIKNYLRIDDEYADDDILLMSLISAAEMYIRNSTGKVYSDENELYNLLIKFLVSNWYENRETIQQGNVNEVPYSITTLLHHLAMSSAYGDTNDNTDNSSDNGDNVNVNSDDVDTSENVEHTG